MKMSAVVLIVFAGVAAAEPEKVSVPAGPRKPLVVPAELATLGKAIAGTWRCRGQAQIANKLVDVKATLSHRVDSSLNKLWIHSTFSGNVRKFPMFRFTSFTTYDTKEQKLWRVRVNSRGGRVTELGSIAGSKVTWEGDARYLDGVDLEVLDIKVRQTEELVSPRAMKIVGEASRDGGKTWRSEGVLHVIEWICKK